MCWQVNRAATTYGEIWAGEGYISGADNAVIHGEGSGQGRKISFGAFSSGAGYSAGKSIAIKLTGPQAFDNLNHRFGHASKVNALQHTFLQVKGPAAIKGAHQRCLRIACCGKGDGQIAAPAKAVQPHDRGCKIAGIKPLHDEIAPYNWHGAGGINNHLPLSSPAIKSEGVKVSGQLATAHSGGEGAFTEIDIMKNYLIRLYSEITVNRAQEIKAHFLFRPGREGCVFIALIGAGRFIGQRQIGAQIQ